MLRSRFRWKARETWMLVYLVILGIVTAWKFIPRPWHASITLETRHYLIYSTASRQQTEETAHTLDLLYQAYSNRLGSLETFQREHPRLKVKLFKDRAEFRRINPNLDWAEAHRLNRSMNSVPPGPGRCHHSLSARHFVTARREIAMLLP